MEHQASHRPSQIAELRSLCHRAMSATNPDFVIAGHRVTIQSLFASEALVRPHIRPHMHSYYEALLFLGPAEYLQGDQRQLIRSGTIMVHAPLVMHDWQIGVEPCRYVQIAFEMRPELPVISPASWPHHPELVETFFAMVEITRHRPPGYPALIAAQLFQLIAAFLTMMRWPHRVDHDMHANNELVMLVEELLRNNLHRKISVEEIAHYVGMSRRSLTRHFHSLTGISVSEYHLQMRLDQISYLLETTALPIAEIAAQIGLKCNSYLYRLYRKNYGVSPEQYRNTLRRRQGS